MNQLPMSELAQKMLDKQANQFIDDPVYQQDLSELGGQVKINWDFAGTKVSQIYSSDAVTGEVGKHMDDADVLIEYFDEDMSAELLINEKLTQYNKMEGASLFSNEYEIGYRTDNFFELNENGKITKEMVKVFKVTVREGFKLNYLNLTKLPIFRPAFRALFDESARNPMDLGYYIPVNKSFDGGEMAKKVFHHYIDTTGSIYRLEYCPCRNHLGSKYRVDLGCIHYGDDTLQMSDSKVKGTYIPPEEAKQVLDEAIEDGLVPLLGRAEGESTGFGLQENGKLLSTCYCGEDACINAIGYKELSSGALKMFRRVPGLRLEVDRDKCVGCGKCMKMCSYRGMQWVDEKPEIIERCLGCGRCEKVCPTGAISFILDDDIGTITANIISEIDKVCDVTPQGK